MAIPLIKHSLNFTVRSLTPFDAEELREIRLESLRHYGDIFESFHKQEEEKSLAYWIEQATATDERCFFGLFCEDALVGVMAARKWEKATDNKTAFWWGNYTRPEYRGLGATRGLYEARIAWTARHGFDHALAYILDGANRPEEILRRLEGKKLYSEAMSFAGGPEALWHWFKVPTPAKTAYAISSSHSNRLSRQGVQHLSLPLS